MLAGKLYHNIGPLEATDDKPAFAQLYVHDPAAEDDEAIRRRSHMYMDAKASKVDKARALELLTELQRCDSVVGERAEARAPLL